MSDFLATLAAQALSAAPVAHPLVPARYAPMPPIGGVGTLEGLRAGGGMAALSPEGPPPSQDRLDLPPPLIEPGAHDTAYYPFSYLQLQQASGYQATLAPAASAGVAVEPGIEPPALATDSGTATDANSTEPAPSHDADQPIIIASTALAAEPAYPARDAAGPPARIAEPLVATQPAVHQADATVPPRVLPTPPIAEAVAPPPATEAQQTDLAGPSTPGDAHVPSTVRSASVAPAAAETSASPVAERSATVLSIPPTAAVPPAMAEQPASAASTMSPATERSAPAPDPVVFSRREGAAPAFLAEPTSDAESLPRPVPDSRLQASAGPSDQLQTLQMQPPTGEMPAVPRPEIVAPPPAARPPHADTVDPPVKANAAERVPSTPPPGTPVTAKQQATGQQPAKADAAERVLSTPPDAAAGPSTVIQRSPVVPDSVLAAEAAHSSGSILGDEGQPFALPLPTESLAHQPAQTAASRPEMAAVQPALNTALRRSVPGSSQVGVEDYAGWRTHTRRKPRLLRTNLGTDLVKAVLSTERSVPAPDHVASPRSQVALPAFPAKPAAGAEPSPRPDFASTTEVSAGPGDQPQALTTQSATDAMPSVPRPEVVAAPSAARSPLSQTADSFSMEAPGQPAGTPMDEDSSTSRGVRRTPRTPELVRAFSGQAPRRPAGTSMDENLRARSETGPSDDERVFSKQGHALPAETGDSSGPVPGSTIQPPAVARPRESIASLPAQTAVARPELATARPAPAASVDPPAMGRNVPPPAPRAPVANTKPPTEESSTVAQATVAPATATPATLARHGHALPAEAAKSLGPVSAAAGQPPPFARRAESMAPLAAWGRGQTTADRLEQAPEQPAPAASVKPSAAAPNAPASMLSPLKGHELARAASDGLEASRSQPAGEQAVVRPVLPAGSDTPAGHALAGRNEPNREPAPLPTIRVTIGRIEVRSSTPALPAAASSPGRPRPALSLDDYLKPPAKVRP